MARKPKPKPDTLNPHFIRRPTYMPRLDCPSVSAETLKATLNLKPQTLEPLN